MKTFSIDPKAFEEFHNSLTDDQKAKLKDGVKVLASADADALRRMLDSEHVLAGCDCGPGGEPGLGSW